MKYLGLAVLLVAASSMPGLGSSYDDLNQGIQARNNEDWNGAVAYFDKALAAGDLIAGLQYLADLDRGQAQLSQGHLDEAIADYTASLALRPGDTAALSERSAAYFIEGKFDQSADDLDAVIAAHPFYSGMYLRRAMVNTRRGAVEKSLADLTAVRSHEAGNFGLYRSIGIAEWQTGQTEQAATDFSAALSKKPDDIYAWLWLSLTEVRLGKPVPKRSLPDSDRKTWPGPIADLFLGSQAQDAVFAAAGQGDEKVINGQICEANFYVGEWLLQHHDAAAAKPLLQKAAGDCPKGFVEWSPAQSELKNLP